MLPPRVLAAGAAAALFLQQAFGAEAGATADAALRLRVGDGVMLSSVDAAESAPGAGVGPASFMLLSAELGSGDWEAVEGGQGPAAVLGVGSFPLWVGGSGGTSAYCSRSASPPPPEQGKVAAVAAAWEAGVRLCSHPVGDWGCDSDDEGTWPCS